MYIYTFIYIHINIPRTYIERDRYEKEAMNLIKLQYMEGLVEGKGELSKIYETKKEVMALSSPRHAIGIS